ncbi:MAG: DUF4476 domain-containing protein [Ferruginibacter sp.]
MAGEKAEDNMISDAKKIFKSKCFTTKQIQNLGVLFSTDAGKYNFFDAAYGFVLDSQNYHSLESNLSDPYYINRFEAMIHH